MSDPVLDIFSEAVDLSLDERAAYLDRFCGGNAELRRKVETLLAQDSAASKTFLPLPPPDPRLDSLFEKPDSPDGLIGKVVGAYTIRSRIASGGMGTVYLAEQANPRREVALKVMHGGFAGAAMRRRFEHEARILGLLRHPHIAQVFEAGTATVETADGHSRRVSFFALEFVPGASSITQYAQALSLTLRRRLELFAEICDAVHHGHQRGIVHRDLKPANILVDDAGRPKIVDFGVARVTDSDIAVTTMQTDAGQLIGTLAYMSPEQCAADPSEIHTPSDVYSLGVVLFELLTGRLPYDVSHLTIHAAARMICEQDPASPSQFDRHLKGDVETIVLKAMEKDRTKRYASAAALAEDIRRHLRGESISARPPTRFTRLLGWAARRPILTTALLCAGLIIATTTSTYLTVRYLNWQPYQLLTFTKNQQSNTELGQGYSDEARLEARNKNVLRKWGGSAGAIHDTLLLERNIKFGGKIALIAFAKESPEFPGSIVAFNAFSPNADPVWQDRIVVPSDLPDCERMKNESRWDFNPFAIWRFDVFDLSAGDEIIVVYGHSYSMRCIRVYGQDGTILYEAWHDGAIADMRWLKNSKRMVVLAHDDSDKHAIAESTGKPASIWMMFAIEPALGTRSREILKTSASFGTVPVRQVKYFHPPVLDSDYVVGLSDQVGNYGLDEHAGVVVTLKTGPIGVVDRGMTLVVDSDCNELHGSRNLGDSKNLPGAEKLGKIRLEDAPPTKAE